MTQRWTLIDTSPFDSKVAVIADLANAVVPALSTDKQQPQQRRIVGLGVKSSDRIIPHDRDLRLY